MASGHLDGRPVALSVLEYRLLSYQHLLQRVWGELYQEGLCPVRNMMHGGQAVPQAGRRQRVSQLQLHGAEGGVYCARGEETA